MAEDIEKIPTEELKCDLKDTIQDINICEGALIQGINFYGDERHSVKYRLEQNKKMKIIIETELRKRGEM